jgi:hypothetical protein
VRRKIRTPVIDECRLEGMLREITGLDALVITPEGKVSMPDDSTIDQDLAVLHGLLDSHDASAVRGRFLAGNFVNQFCFRHGDKAAILQHNFSDHDYNRLRKFARVAAAWGWNPGLTWGWSFYEETAKLNRQQQTKVVAKWHMGKYTIVHFRADKEFNTVKFCPTSDKRDQNTPNPTLSNTKYVGFGSVEDALKALVQQSNYQTVQATLDALREQEETDQFAEEDD